MTPRTQLDNKAQVEAVDNHSVATKERRHSNTTNTNSTDTEHVVYEATNKKNFAVHQNSSSSRTLSYQRQHAPSFIMDLFRNFKKESKKTALIQFL